MAVPRNAETVHSGMAGRVGMILSRLISYYGLDAQAASIHELFDLISRESLLSFETGGDRPYSAVNGNGFPAQFSVSLGAETKALRCLGEVAASHRPMPERLRLSTLRLREILALLGRRSASAVINQLFAILFPDDPTAVLGWTGGMWMAFGATPGSPLAFRLYVNQRWGDVAERFVRIGRVFSLLDRSQSLALWRRIAGPVSTGAVPYGVAFDVVGGGIGQFKVYLASAGADRRYLETLLECAGLGRRLGRLTRWLECCGLDRPGLPPWGVLPSLEFGVVPGEPLGLKLDVSCHHLRTCDVDMDRGIRMYLREFRFDLEEYEAVLQAVSPGRLSAERVERIQYCGIGFRGGDAARFNVYLCPDIC